MNPRIFIADDHEIVREGIRTLLAKCRPDWEVCGEASNARDAIELVKTLEPDVVILDITMPGLSGLEAAHRLSKLGLSSRILIFTMHESDRLATEVRGTGAHGYVLKSQAARDLVLAIQTLLDGGTFFGTAPNSLPSEGEKPKTGITFCESLALPAALHPKFT